mmetsp:Transcript_115753/g.265762  ORF Transcript_115753/g.265762 Transcript_115753/m.265762 type:complete len:365 (-) Transcript_115753:189-1283(-)
MWRVLAPLFVVVWSLHVSNPEAGLAVELVEAVSEAKWGDLVFLERGWLPALVDLFSDYVLIGIVLETISNIGCAAGLTVQKASWGDGSADGMSSPLWYWGSALYVVSAMPDFFAYFFAPAVVIVIVAGTYPVFVALFAWLFLGEEVSMRAIVASAVCIISATCILWYAAANSVDKEMAATTWTVEVLAMLLWIAGAGVVMGLLATLEYYDIGLTIGPTDIKVLYVPIVGATMLSIERIFNNQLGKMLLYLWPREGFRVFLRQEILICLIVIPITAAFCFCIVSYGVKKYSNHVFIPTYFAFCIIVQFFSSWLVLREFAKLSQFEIGLMMMAACIAMGGIYVLNADHKSSDAEEKPVQESKENGV